MRGQLRRDSRIAILLWMTVGVLAIAVAHRYPVQLDLTRDQRHTLAAATQTTLDRLTEPVDVHAFLPTHVQPPYRNVVRRIIDLLEAYASASDGLIRVQIHDPTDPALSAAELRALGEAARGYGIRSAELEITVADRKTRQDVLFGIALLYRDRQAVVPPVSEPELVEYEMTRALLDLVRERRPRIGLAQGHGEPNLIGSPLEPLLRGSGDVRNVTIGEAQLPLDLDVLVILAPTQPLAERERYVVDQFLMHGKSLVALLDYRQQSTVFPEVLVPVSSGLEPLLSKYGMTVDPTRTILNHARNFAAPVRRTETGEVIRANHPAYPIARLDRGGIITQGLEQVVMPFASPITLDAAQGVTTNPIITVTGTARTNVRSLYPDDFEDPVDANRTKPGVFIAGATVEGMLASAFAGSSLPARTDGAIDRPFLKTGQGSARVFLATAGARMLATQENGLLLLQNAVDWAVSETHLIALRGRRAEVPRLRATTPALRAWIQYGNLFGPALLFGLLGLVRWRRSR